MKVYQTLCLLITIWLSLSTAQANSVFYTGLDGKQKVVLQLRDLADISPDQTNQIIGRLFVDPTKLDDYFKGTIQPNAAIELKLITDDQQTNSKLKLNRILKSTDISELPDQLDVEWINLAGKHKLLQLQKYILDCDKSFCGEDEAYAKFRKQSLVLRKLNTQTVQGHQLQWYEDAATKVQMFTVLDGYPPKILNQINQILRERFISDVLDYHSCQLAMKSLWNSDTDFEQDIMLSYFSPNAVSVSIYKSINCGGAHPDAGESEINLGIINHEVHQLALEDVFWLGENYPLSAHYSGRDFEIKQDSVYWDYRSKTFAPWIVQKFGQLYAEQIKAEQQECEYNNAEHWDSLHWYLTPKGLYIGPSFSYSMRFCESPDWAILPYAQVKKHPSWFKVQP